MIQNLQKPTSLFLHTSKLLLIYKNNPVIKFCIFDERVVMMLFQLDG